MARGRLPRPLDPTPLLEPNEGGIQRALIQPELMFGKLLKSRRDPVSVLGSHGHKRAEHDEVKRARQQIDARTITARGHGENIMAYLHLLSKWRKAQVATIGSFGSRCPIPLRERPVCEPAIVWVDSVCLST